MKGANSFLSVLAIIGALASGVLFYLIQGQKEQLTSERDQFRQRYEQADARANDLDAKNQDLERRNGELGTELGEVKSRNTQLEARFNQISRDLNAARTELATAQQSQRALQAENSQLKRDLVEARTILESGPASPARLAEAETRVAQLTKQVEELEAKLGNRLQPGEPVPLINTSVATVGPRSAFVVLNAGSAAGLKQDMKVAIERDGTMIAQATVTELKENFAVALVIPNTLLRAPVPGDAAFSVN